MKLIRRCLISAACITTLILTSPLSIANTESVFAALKSIQAASTSSHSSLTQVNAHAHAAHTALVDLQLTFSNGKQFIVMLSPSDLTQVAAQLKSTGLSNAKTSPQVLNEIANLRIPVKRPPPALCFRSSMGACVGASMAAYQALIGNVQASPP